MKRGTTVIFIDESGYTLTPRISPTWALKGLIPEISHVCGTWRKLSAISGLAVCYVRGALQTRLFFRLHPGKSIRSKEVVDFLRQILYQLDGHIIVVWDNLKAHKSRKVKDFLGRHARLEMELLPPYCPELNPDEGVWNWSKTKDLVNVCARDAAEIVKLVRGSLMRVQCRAHIRRWCLHESELSFGQLND